MTANFCDYRIREWSSSYYHNEARVWYYGTLHINVGGVIFTEDQSKCSKPLLLHVKFKDIAEVKKTTTGLIFSALVIITNTGLKHWISSLGDRSSVFNTLCYFKRSQVLTRERKVRNHGPAERGTAMGRKLLKVAHDSQNTLTNAADMLHSQVFVHQSLRSCMGNDLKLGNYFFIIVIAKVHRGNYTEILKKVYHSVWLLC